MGVELTRFVNMVVCTICHPDYPEVHELPSRCLHGIEHTQGFYINISNRPWFNEPNCFYTYGLLIHHWDSSLGYTR